uniref:CCDC66 domain-containing protein n=2 Tax=Caenorhabditis tropicalis TaxID=1561998 RepID=A0A1I7U1V7_9PELO
MPEPMNFFEWHAQMQAETESAVRGLIEHDPDINQEPLFPHGTPIELRSDPWRNQNTGSAYKEDPEQEKLRKQAKRLREEREEQWRMSQERRHKEKERMKKWRIQQKNEELKNTVCTEEQEMGSLEQDLEVSRKRKERQIEELSAKKLRKTVDEEFDGRMSTKESKILPTGEREEKNLSI